MVGKPVITLQFLISFNYNYKNKSVAYLWGAAYLCLCFP